MYWFSNSNGFRDIVQAKKPPQTSEIHLAGHQCPYLKNLSWKRNYIGRLADGFFRINEFPPRGTLTHPKFCRVVLLSSNTVTTIVVLFLRRIHSIIKVDSFFYKKRQRKLQRRTLFFQHSTTFSTLMGLAKSRNFSWRIFKNIFN